MTARKSGIVLMIAAAVMAAACSTHKNTARGRFQQAFNARYNTYYNGHVAYLDGEREKQDGHHDDFTATLPMNAVGQKKSRDLGSANYKRAVEKMEKTIKLHSIKGRPEWKKSRRKTAKDIEWLSRREYNPFIWKAWLLLGKAQFEMGQFDESAATFSYMQRLYSTQPRQSSLARAWLARSYIENGWLYEADDVIQKQRRDSIHYSAQSEWDRTLALYSLATGDTATAAQRLRKVISRERAKKQKARHWYLLGQLDAALGRQTEAYRDFGRAIRQNPPYELEFNARIAQTEVLASGKGQERKMLRRLRRMAASDKNKDYLDRVYYAIGNIQLAARDTTAAIVSYEKGNERATRSGVEKGVLLLRLGDVYWQRERYADAGRCYGEAIGMLDRERKDYEQLAYRSKSLDELVPFTEAVHLQDSLQQLAAMSEAERNAAIDRVIKELKKKEEKAKRDQQAAEAERQSQQQSAQNGRNLNPTTPPAGQKKDQTWYFYNPMTVSQGKQSFQQLWGRRDNTDDWQRANRTVVSLAEPADTAATAAATDADTPPETAAGEAAPEKADGKKTGKEGGEPADSAALDPHKREYYLAQIPFTDEQKAASDEIIKDGLLHSGIIFKDKLDNLRLSEKQLRRLTSQWPDYAQNDQAWYHLYLLYLRRADSGATAECLAALQAGYPQSELTILVSDPHYAENARYGIHREDSLYAATYSAFRDDRTAEMRANIAVAAERYPLGAHRPKFMFVEGMDSLASGRPEGCVALMTRIVEKYPDNEIAPLAGMIVKGVKSGRKIHSSRFDIGDIWERRSQETAAADSLKADTLSAERDTPFTFILAFAADSLDANQLLYALAKHNFTSYLVRKFDLSAETDDGLTRMAVSGFLNYDEALQYARELADDEDLRPFAPHCRRILISEANLPLLGTRYSFNDYQKFFESHFAPLSVSEERLLDVPDDLPAPVDPDDVEQEDPTDDNGQKKVESPDNPNFDFDDDFYN